QRQRSPVFRGAMVGDNGFLAVVEESGGNLLNLRKGDSLPNGAGVVEDVTLDYMSFRTPERELRKILLGQNLRGAVPEPEAVVSTDAGPAGEAATRPGDAATAAPPAAAPVTSGGGDISLEEIRRRMMQRRQQQGGR